jgi:hypothetical protein
VNCPNCGTWNNSAFCTACGYSLLDSKKTEPNQIIQTETAPRERNYLFRVSVLLALISSIATGSIYAVLSTELDNAISDVRNLTSQVDSQRGILAAAEIDNDNAQDEYSSRLLCNLSYASWVCTAVWGSESVLLAKSTLTQASVDVASATLRSLQDNQQKAIEKRVELEDNRSITLGAGGVSSGVFVVSAFIALAVSKRSRTKTT